MADEEQVPDKVSVQELEKEFGLEGNTDAAESDEANTDPGNLDSIEKETTEAEGVDTTAIERHISDDEALRGIDDNVELAKAQAKLDQEAADAAALDEKVVDDAVTGDIEAETGDPEAEGEKAAKDAAVADEKKADAEKAGAEKEEGDAGKDGDVEGGKKSGDAAAEGDKKAAADAGEGDEHEQDLNKWLEDNLDDEGADDMAAALVRKNAKVTFKSDGQMVTIPLQQALERAAGYAGQETVDARSQKAGVDLKAAEQIKTAAEATVQRAEDTVKTVTAQIDDPEKFGAFLTNRADLPYLKTLHAQLGATIEGAEENPQGFAMSRRLTGIETALGQLLNGGAETAGGDTGDGAGPDTQAKPTGDPASIPDDLGFIRGQGYPREFTQLARRDTETALKAARAVGGPDVAYDAVVDVWVKEGRTRPITEVAQGLLESGVRDSSKKKIAGKPPTRSKTPSRVTTQKAKPTTDAPVGESDWDEIPAQIERALKAELQS